MMAAVGDAGIGGPRSEQKHSRQFIVIKWKRQTFSFSFLAPKAKHFTEKLIESTPPFQAYIDYRYKTKRQFFLLFLDNADAVRAGDCSGLNNTLKTPAECEDDKL